MRIWNIFYWNSLLGRFSGTLNTNITTKTDLYVTGAKGGQRLVTKYVYIFSKQKERKTGCELLVLGIRFYLKRHFCCDNRVQGPRVTTLNYFPSIVSFQFLISPSSILFTKFVDALTNRMQKKLFSWPDFSALFLCLIQRN